MESSAQGCSTKVSTGRGRPGRRNCQLSGDGLVRPARRQHPQHLPLAGGQRVWQAGEAGQSRHRGDVPVVDAVAAQRRVDERAERILAGAGDDRGAPSVPGRRDRDVGRAAAEILAEGLYLIQSHADLLRVQIDADASHGEHFEGGHADAQSRSAPRGVSGLSERLTCIEAASLGLRLEILLSC